VELVQAMISSLVTMVSKLMVTTIEEGTVADARRHIKIFLSRYEAFDKGLRKEGVPPKWISTQNFMSLLNLPSIMEDTGPLRLLWEGGSKGEGALRLIKCLLHGLHGNWPCIATTKFLHNKSMRRILTILEGECILNCVLINAVLTVCVLEPAK
jgi:hypothetical protein